MNKKDNQQPKIQNAQKYFLKEDTVYGNYKTIRQVKIQGPKCMETRWECIYLPTGETKLQKSSYLKKFATGDEQAKLMQELVEKDQHQMGLRGYLFRMYKHNAGLRDRQFNLTFDEFNKIIQQPCYYCGEPPRPASNEMLKARGNTKQPTLYYNGVDRLDPKGNYDKDNVVACCPVCNYMKHVYTKDEFFNHIIKIYNYQNLGSTTIAEASTPLIANEWWKQRTPNQKDLDEDIVSTSTEM